MDIKNRIRRNLTHYAIGVGVAGAFTLAFESPVAAVPDCNCSVYNYPNPGNGPIPGVRVDGNCYLDPCGS